MPRELALFPLQIVVFPGEAVNLHIFEPRYRELIKDCQEDGITFGIPTFQNGKVLDFGTEVELLSIEKRYPGGEMDIKTRARGIFQILDFLFCRRCTFSSIIFCAKGAPQASFFFQIIDDNL